MARLPTLDDLGGRPTPNPRPAIIQVSNAGSVGDAIETVGTDAAKLGEHMLEQKDKLQAATAQSNFLTKKIQLDSNAATDEDYKTLPDRYGKDIEAVRREAAQSIQSPAARAAFMLDTAPDVARGIAGVQQKVFVKAREADRGQLDETINNNGTAALAAPDPTDSMKLIETSSAAIDAAKNAGTITPEEAVALRVKATEQYAKGRVSLFSTDKQIELLGESLKSEKTGSFLDFLPIDKRKLLYDEAVTKKRTEERAARADQRLAMQAGIDDAEDTLRLSDSGVPLPEDKLVHAQGIAKAAGKEALAFGLGTAIVKNRLNSEYKSSTPAEMQDDINVLNVKITKAGTKVDPVDVITRDHLTKLRDQASSALAKDPLSWGSSALGLNIPPLNWDDPVSLQQRVKAAALISSRTGTQPKYLTDEEVATLAPQAASPDPNQRSGLAFQLAKAGPQFGSIAARQVAPSDDGLVALVGLATVPNSSVAKSLVAKAVQGPEILKAFPKMIGNNFEQTYSGTIGNTLRLMPGAERGVREVARNLLASNQALAGIHVDGDTPEAVKASVNGALGAYNDHGVMRGGIGTHAGKPTVLPEGMSQTEFDTTVARADAIHLRSAANGAPVWSNGRPLYTAELKGMEMVPVGDSRYRFSNGSDYVAKKGGGFFELDVRQLPRK